MSKKTSKENVPVTAEVSPVEETQEVDPLEPQAGDSSEVLAYKRLIAEYKQKNPKKYENKREEFIKKLQGQISMNEVYGPNGKLIRRTFNVPNIQSKRVR